MHALGSHNPSSILLECPWQNKTPKLSPGFFVQSRLRALLSVTLEATACHARKSDQASTEKHQATRFRHHTDVARCVDPAFGVRRDLCDVRDHRRAAFIGADVVQGHSVNHCSRHQARDVHR